MRRYDHVVFDIDETLVHSTPATLAGLDALLERRSLPPRTPEQRRQGVGTSPPNVREQLGIAVDQDFVDEWIRCVGELYLREARLFDGVVPMLDALASDGIGLGIVTSELGWELRQNFSQLGLLPRFGTVVALDDCTRRKPDPDPLLRWCELAGADPSRVLYVGDARMDAECARAAGIDFCLACWGEAPQPRHLPAAAYALQPWDVVEVVRQEGPVGEREPWLMWVRELQAIAQAGLWYGRDPFDVERFGRIREMATEALSLLAQDVPARRIPGLFADEEGYQTPKMDSRAVIFDDEGRLCLVRERQGGWTLPGGWVDQGQTVFSNAVKEAREEAGLEVVPVRLIALLEHNLHNEHPFAWGIAKAFVICEALGGDFEENVETLERGFFPRDDIPPLLRAKTTEEQVEMCFAAYDAGLSWQVVVD